MAKRNNPKLLVRKGPAGRQGIKERIVEAEALDVHHGQLVVPNRSIDVRLLPSVHGIMGNLYQTIDAESRRLCSIATTGTGLDKGDSLHLGQLTRSLVQLVNLQHGLEEIDALESMTDEELQAHAGPALEKFLSSRGISMNKFLEELSPEKSSRRKGEKDG